MPTRTLKLEPAEIIEFVNMTGEDHIFEIGDEVGKISESSIVTMMEGEEQEALSALPDHYRNIIKGNILGEYLTDKQLGAKAGTTTLQLAFYPMVEDSLILFLNYDENSEEPFKAVTRDNPAVLSTDEYTVNATTGEITLLSALAEGDKVLAIYRHTAGQLFTSIRQIVLKLSRLELRKRSQNWNEGIDGINQEREELLTKLLSFDNGGNPKGIDEIDSVQFITETRPSRGVTMRIPIMGGR